MNLYEIMIAQRAEGIWAWTLTEYSGGMSNMRKRRLRTPKMCSITFWACACRKLKSSALFSGLKI